MPGDSEERRAGRRIRVAVLALGAVSANTGGRSYLEGVLEPLGRQPGLDVEVHASDPAFAVPPTCRRVAHRSPPGSAGRLAAELWAARAEADVLLAPLNFLPPGARGPAVVVEHNILALPSGAGAGPDLLRRLYRPRALRHTLRRAAAVVAVSEHLRDRLCEDFPWLDAVRVVPLGVGEGIRQVGGQRRPGPARRVLVASALWEYKRVDLALEAFASATRALPDTRLDIAGPGSPGRLAALERRARELGIGDRVTFLGNVPGSGMTDLYARADALVHLSEIESFGLPVLEGLAAGLPVVARPLPALREVAGNVPMWADDAQEAGKALRRALTDEGVRADAARRGPMQAAPFTWARCAVELADALRATAPSPAASPQPVAAAGR